MLRKRLVLSRFTFVNRGSTRNPIAVGSLVNIPRPPRALRSGGAHAPIRGRHPLGRPAVARISPLPRGSSRRAAVPDAPRCGRPSAECRIGVDHIHGGGVVSGNARGHSVRVGKEPGETVSVTVELDTAERTVEVSGSWPPRSRRRGSGSLRRVVLYRSACACEWDCRGRAAGDAG